MRNATVSKTLKTILATMTVSSLISFNAVAAEYDGDSEQLLNMKKDSNVSNMSGDKAAVLPRTPSDTDSDLSNDDMQAGTDNMDEDTDYSNQNAYGDAGEMSKTLHFEFDSTQLTGASQETFDELKEQLGRHENQDAEINIVGYADSTGPEEYNMHLSEQRAKAIKAELNGLGLDVTDWSVEGEGEANPIAENDTMEGRAENRRVELQISIDEEEKVTAADM